MINDSENVFNIRKNEAKNVCDTFPVNIFGGRTQEIRMN